MASFSVIDELKPSVIAPRQNAVTTLDKAGPDTRDLLMALRSHMGKAGEEDRHKHRSELIQLAPLPASPARRRLAATTGKPDVSGNGTGICCQRLPVMGSTWGTTSWTALGRY